MKARTDILERKDEILQWIDENLTNTEIAKRINCKFSTLMKYYKIMGIEYKGNQGGKGMPGKKKTLLELIKSSNSVIHCQHIRKKLVEEGYKEDKCEICGISEWMGKPLTLELHHIDFNHWNNTLENFQLLCPNCHAQVHSLNHTLKRKQREIDKTLKRIKVKKEKDIKQKEKEQKEKEIILNLINNSGIDFSQSGWSSKAKQYLKERDELWNVGIFRCIRKYAPEFLEREDVWKRKGSKI